MRLALVCAFSGELQPLARRLAATPFAAAGFSGLGRIQQDELDIALAAVGVGGILASRGLERLLDIFAAERVLCLGIGGGLDPALGSGDLLQLTEIGRYSWPDLTAGDWLTLSPLPCSGGNKTVWPQGRGVTHGARILHRAAEKQSLGQGAGAKVVDMETWYLADICRRRQIPFAALRAISDPAGQDMPDLNPYFDPQKGVKLVRLAAGLALHPQQLWHWQKSGKKAIAALSQSWPNLLPRLRRWAEGPRDNPDCRPRFPRR